MHNPTTRVLAVLELLQTHGRLSGAEMAARLEIDARTLRRYIATLEQMGIPILSERGRFGGYALMPGYKLPPMMFSDDETLALSVGLLAARQLGFAGSVPAAASAQAKIERILPPALKTRVRAMSDMVGLGLSRGAPLRDNNALVVLSAAALARQRVHLGYRNLAGEDSERDVDPYGIAFHAGSWYLLGQCHLRASMRSFRLDRVRHVRAIGAAFAPPAGFDPLAQLRQSLASIPRAFAVRVLLATDLHQAVTHLSDTIGVFEQTPDGVRLRCETDHPDWFAGRLAALPFEFHVEECDALRASLARLGERLLLRARPAA